MNLNKELAEALASVQHRSEFKVFKKYLQREHERIQANLRIAENHAVFTAQGSERVIYEILRCIDQAPNYLNKHK